MLELFANRRKKMTIGWFMKVKLVFWASVAYPNPPFGLTWPGWLNSWEELGRIVPSGSTMRSGWPSDRSKLGYNPNFKSGQFAFRVKNWFYLGWFLPIPIDLGWFRLIWVGLGWFGLIWVNSGSVWYFWKRWRTFCQEKKQADNWFK